MNSIKQVEQKNNVVLTAFIDLIDTGLSQGMTLQQFRDFIEREQRPYCGMCDAYQNEKVGEHCTKHKNI